MPKPLFTPLGLSTVLLLGALGTGLPASADEVPSTRSTPAPGGPTPLLQPDNPAVIELLESAAEAFNAGRLEHAGVALERALRIEPGNAAIWHDLGQTRLQQGHYQQAESLALKSNSLAGDDAALRTRNARLIDAARQASGQDRVPAFTDPERLALQNRLDEEIERRRQAEAQAAALRERLEQEPAQRRQAGASQPASISPSLERPASVPDPDQAERARQEDGFVMEKTPRHDTREARLGAEYDRGSSQIPPGHRPPPGRCRIWFPDRPPGHQPPPGNCRELRRQVPPGAWLVGP